MQFTECNRANLSLIHFSCMQWAASILGMKSEPNSPDSHPPPPNRLQQIKMSCPVHMGNLTEGTSYRFYNVEGIDLAPGTPSGTISVHPTD